MMVGVCVESCFILNSWLVCGDYFLGIVGVHTSLLPLYENSMATSSFQYEQLDNVLK